MRPPAPCAQELRASCLPRPRIHTPGRPDGVALFHSQKFLANQRLGNPRDAKHEKGISKLGARGPRRILVREDFQQASGNPKFLSPFGETKGRHGSFLPVRVDDYPAGVPTREDAAGSFQIWVLVRENPGLLFRWNGPCAGCVPRPDER